MEKLFNWKRFCCSNANNGKTFAIGGDYEVGTGAVNVGVSSYPVWKLNTGVYSQAGNIYQIYYDFPVAGVIKIKPLLQVTWLA